MLGYEPFEFPASYETWVSLIHAEDLERAVSVAEEYLKTKPDVYENEFRMKTRNGNYRWMHAKARVTKRDKDGNAEYMIGNHEDVTDRRLAEESLLDHKRRLEYILQGTNVGTWEWNVQTGETIFNQRWAEIIGYTFKEITPITINTWMNFCHPDDLKKSERLLKDCFEGRSKYYHCECRMKHKDGSWIWVLDRGKVATWSDDGKPEWMYGTHQDITERKRAEEELLATKEKLSNILNNMIDVVWSVSWPDFTHLYLSPSIEKLYGRPAQDFYDNPSLFKEVVHPDDRHLNEKAIEQLLEEGESVKECRIVRPDGSIFWAFDRSKMIYDEDHQPIRVDGVTHDITARKLAEAKLKESEELYRKLLSTMPDLIVQTDLNGNIIFVNDYPFPNLKFMPKENILGKNMLSFIAEKDQLRALENTKLMFDQSLGPREYQLILADGTFMDAEVNGDVIHDAENNSKGMVYVIRDITERKKIEKQLLLIEKGESLSRMAGAIAHHFNNILMITIGHLEMIQGDIPQGTDTADSIKEAAQAAHQAVALSKLMLTYLGQGVRKNEKIDLSELCRRKMKDLSKAMPKTISLTTRFEFTGLIVQSDHSYLEQLLSIMLENAVEALAGKTSGKISVTLEPAESSDIQYIHMFPNNWQAGPEEYARLVFSDTGKGMAEETIHRIFDPFYSDKFTGRGLGLAVALGIVKAHGGCICVQSKAGKGTNFIIFLPLSTMTEPGSTGNSS